MVIIMRSNSHNYVTKEGTSVVNENGMVTGRILVQELKFAYNYYNTMWLSSYTYHTFSKSYLIILNEILI